MNNREWGESVSRLLNLQEKAGHAEGNDVAKYDQRISEVERYLDDCSQSVDVRCATTAVGALGVLNDILTIEALKPLRESAIPLILDRLRRWILSARDASHLDAL